MSSLHLVIHYDGDLSIKDLNHSIDISEFKWDKMIKYMAENAAGIYFAGYRLSYNGEPKETIGYLTEQALFDPYEGLERILIRIKPIHIMNRSLLSKLWACYDQPFIIFLADLDHEDTLMEWHHSHADLLGTAQGVYMIFQTFEHDVLWIKSNIDMTPLLFLMKNKEV